MNAEPLRWAVHRGVLVPTNDLGCPLYQVDIAASKYVLVLFPQQRFLALHEALVRTSATLFWFCDAHLDINLLAREIQGTWFPYVIRGQR